MIELFRQQMGLSVETPASLYTAKRMLQERKIYLEKQLASVKDWTIELAEIDVMLRGEANE